MILLRSLISLLLGNYVVTRKIHYGQIIRFKTLKRFRTLEAAKAFAKTLTFEPADTILVANSTDRRALVVFKHHGLRHAHA